MRMVRQPTIRSMFFLMTLVAVVARSLGIEMRSSHLPWPLGVSSVMYLVIPVVLPLFIRRLEIVTTILLLICVWASLLFNSVAYTLSSHLPIRVLELLGGFYLPLVGIVRSLELKILWLFLIIFYAAFYIALGPLFALTCRMRPAQET